MNHLVIMAKAPQAGLVKTRLARETGTAEAVRVYRTVLDETLRNLGGERRWQTWLSVAPDKNADSPFWPSHIPVLEQGSGDLWRRMQRIFNQLPRGPAVIIGSDIPAVHVSDIAEAFKLLGGHDCVIGPAPDGGFWLIGLKRFPRIENVFENVRWSTANARKDTLANLSHLKVATAKSRSDLDTYDDYRSWLAARF